MGNIGGIEIVGLLIVALLLFGAKRLPEIGRSLGTGMREFKDSVTGNTPADPPQQLTPPESTTTTPTPTERETVKLPHETAAPPPRPRGGGHARRAPRGAARAHLRDARSARPHDDRRVRLPRALPRLAQPAAPERADSDDVRCRRAVHGLGHGQPVR